MWFYFWFCINLFIFYIMTKYFKEIDDGNMNQEFLAKLDIARGHAGIPFVISSAYRTPEHNEEVGGAKDSAHLKGLAVDIKVYSSNQRYEIIRGLLFAGFHRIGIGKTFIHVDMDSSKAPRVIWDYYK